MYRIIGANGQQYGPVSADTLRRWIAEGRANQLTLVQVEGSSEWKPLSSFPEFAATAPIPPPASGPAPQILPSVGAHPPRTNSMAMTGFICSLLGMSVCGCCWPILSIAGLIFSVVGLNEIKRNPQETGGHGLAIAGIVLGIVGIALGTIFTLLGLLGQFPGAMHTRGVFRF